MKCLNTECPEEIPNEAVTLAYMHGLPDRGWEQSFLLSCSKCGHCHSIKPSVEITFGHANFSQVPNG